MSFLDRVFADGFALAPSVLAKTEITTILGALGESTLRRSRAGARHILSHPAVAAVASDERLLTLARAVLGDEAFPFRATLFDKSATANWLVAWHQDTALPLQERREVAGWGPWSTKDGIHYAHAPAVALERVLALRLHLDDSIAENGPLRVLPGTHVLGVLTDEQMRELASTKKAVECLTSSGGVLAMLSLLVHGSSKSQCELPRRVLHIEYAASKALGDGLELAIA